MKSPVLSGRINLQANFRRYIKSPSIVIQPGCSVISSVTRKHRADFHTDIRFAVLVCRQIERRSQSERNLKSRTLLVGGQRFCRRKGQRLASDILMVGVKRSKQTRFPTRRETVSQFIVHSPPAQLVSKISRQRSVHLPVYLQTHLRHITLCKAPGRQSQQDNTQKQRFFQQFIHCFHLTSSSIIS